jgi:hypothetical protein
MKPIIALALAAVLAAVAIASATNSSAATPGWIVERYYTSETWSSFADVGKKDNGGPGDVYTSQQSLKSLDGKRVGVVNGFGVNLHKPYVFFHWTAALGEGTLTVESAVDLMDKSATYPIAGGTGRYTGARGTITIADAGENRSLATVRYQR